MSPAFTDDKAFRHGLIRANKPIDLELSVIFDY